MKLVNRTITGTYVLFSHASFGRKFVKLGKAVKGWAEFGKSSGVPDIVPFGRCHPQNDHCDEGLHISNPDFETRLSEGLNNLGFERLMD